MYNQIKMEHTQYYAHSGKSKYGILNPQLYSEHISFVYNYATTEFKKSIGKSNGLSDDIKQFLIDSVSIASYWHDLGKLDENCQKYLSLHDSFDGKMLNHVDAGVALTLQLFETTGNTVYLLSAFLIHAHHLGLQNWNSLISEKLSKGFISDIKYQINNSFRDNNNINKLYNILCKETSVSQYTNSKLDKYKKIHIELMGFVPSPQKNYKKITASALDIRIMLSCIIDGDYTDTSLFYSNKNYKIINEKLYASERLNKLKHYVKRLNKNNTSSNIRNESRQKLFELSINHDKLDGFINVDAPVGTGKTIACLSLALNVSIKNNCERIYNILPFTNVISQTVKNYRKYILLKKENKQSIVNEIHSKLEFDDYYKRQYSKLWNAPINVSTAVQFFESIVSNHVSTLRKIHWFSNSVVIFDEYDKSMPHYNWKYILNILIELNMKYNVHFITSSGTPLDYFKLFGIDIKNKSDLLNVNDWNYFQNLEKNRVNSDCVSTPFDSLNQLKNFIFNEMKQNSRNSGLIVLNTIINALYVFDALKDDPHGYEIYHISSCLTPADREKILKTINKKLKRNEKIILVATSIIECGMDFSFDVGFREKTSLLSILQFNGRINRNSKLNDSKNFIFNFTNELTDNKNGLLTENPQLKDSIKAFDVFQKENCITPEYCQNFVEYELNNTPEIKQDFNSLESNKCFRFISDDFKIIESYTYIIIVNKKIIKDILNGKFVSSTKINRNSIQLWSSKKDKLEKLNGIEEIESKNNDKYLIWKNKYDPKYYGIGKTLIEIRS